MCYSLSGQYRLTVVIDTALTFQVEYSEWETGSQKILKEKHKKTLSAASTERFLLKDIALDLRKRFL